MLILGGLVTQVGGEHHNEEITRKSSHFHTEFPGAYDLHMHGYHKLWRIAY